MNTDEQEWEKNGFSIGSFPLPQTGAFAPRGTVRRPRKEWPRMNTNKHEWEEDYLMD
jgi:hypothetical protein